MFWKSHGRPLQFCSKRIDAEVVIFNPYYGNISDNAFNFGPDGAKWKLLQKNWYNLHDTSTRHIPGAWSTSLPASVTEIGAVSLFRWNKSNICPAIPQAELNIDPRISGLLSIASGYDKITKCTREFVAIRDQLSTNVVEWVSTVTYTKKLAVMQYFIFYVICTLWYNFSMYFNLRLYLSRNKGFRHTLDRYVWSFIFYWQNRLK